MDPLPIALFHLRQTLESREDRCRGDQLGILRCVQDLTFQATRGLLLPGDVSVYDHRSDGMKSPHDDVLGTFINLLCCVVNPPCCFVNLICGFVNPIRGFVNPTRGLVDPICSLIDPLCVLVGALL